MSTRKAAEAAEAAAWAALDAALLTAAERRLQVPCAGRWAEFTAEDADVRRRVAAECATCPVLAECGGVVSYVSHGTWAGLVISAGGGQSQPAQS